MDNKLYRHLVPRLRIVTSVFCAVLWCAGLSFAQTPPTQTLSGLVLDKDTRQPLIGATIVVQTLEPPRGASTDVEGRFELPGLSVGRHVLRCHYPGYEPWLSDPIIVNSARETFLTIEIVESAVRTSEAVVTFRKSGAEPINEAALLSARSFSVDETQRYAASANDPGRMAMGFPGVQPSRDSRSDIVVRGNSGIGLLWRLEGVDIPNPNHFARRGSSGGGITIFSVSMLANSDFSTGAFPAEYGNAYSGVFDVKFRKGNPDKREYTLRAGMLGLDFSTEGPFRKGSNATYLVNYRYSTLGILNKFGLHLVGERVDNTFQDLSFNLYFPSKNKKHFFTLWGIGGLSREFEDAVADTADWRSYTDYYTRHFDTDMGALGFTHTATLGDDAFVRTSLCAMGQRILFRNDTLDRGRHAFTVNDEHYRESRFVLASFWNKKFTPGAALKTGFFLHHIPYDLSRKTLGDTTDLAAQGATQLIQPYAQLRLRPGDRFTVILGVHAMFLTLNDRASVEPRLGLRYQFSEKQSVSLAWGLHSRMLPLGNYFTRIGGREVNRDANFVRAMHLVGGFDQILGRGLRLHAEVYWQKSYDVPVAPGSSWSILNTIDGFAKRALVNTGSGENAGLDLSLEKSFAGGTFFILGGSLSRSRYTDAQGREFPTVFDSGVSATFMGGKEWEFRNVSVVQLGFKVLYNGGQRLTPLLPGQPVNRYSPEPLLDESRAFGERVAPYFRPDLRLAFRKNNPRAAWSLALDVQNVIHRRNLDPLTRNYDPDRNEWVYREQSGLTPVLSFQLDL